jgi:predicted negative regulator of RcsB-dependent stress response
VAELRTEEEQIAAMKSWWNDNGKGVLASIAAALFIIFAWKFYENSVLESKTEAATLYEQLLSANAAAGPNSGGASGVGFFASQLKERFSDTEYGVYAALFMAKDAVEKGELDAAVVELEWVKQHTGDSRLIDITNGRLARVLADQGKADEALALLQASEPEFESQFLEIKGDILLRTGKEADALAAYNAAYAQVKDSPQQQPLLLVKLANLGVSPESN